MATKKETTKKAAVKKAAAPKKASTKKVAVKKVEKIVDQTAPQHIGLVYPRSSRPCSLEDWPANSEWQKVAFGFC